MNKLIHKGYYREMLRQLKVAGIISACILMVQQIAVFLGMLVVSSEMLSIPDASTMATAPMLYAYVMGLTLTFIAFNWLNSRANSDFYHSLPITRTSIYFSTVAAIMTWLIVGIIGTGLVNALLYTAFRLPFNLMLYGMVLLNVLASAFIVVGAVSIACALCGTRFVDLAAAVVILFMPRVLFTIFGAFIYKCSGGDVFVKSCCWLFDPSYNVAGTFPYAAILSFLRGGIDYTKLGALIYNFAYGALLTVLGWIAFKKRRSEDAGIPTTSKLFQTVVRCAFGMPLLLILAYLVLDENISWLPVVLLVVFAFIFYCLYELISTKSPKKMAKAMPLFLVCIGVMVLYTVLPPIIARAELAIKVPEKDIKAYYVESDSDYGYYTGILGALFDGSDQNSYGKVMTRHIRFDDERSISIIADAYENARTRGFLNGRRTYDVEYDYGSDVSYTSIIVRLDRKFGRDIVRKISIPDDKYAELQELWNKKEEYHKVNYDFPEGKLFFAVDGISGADSRAIGEVFAKEFAKLTDEQKDSLKNDTGNYFGYSQNYGGSPLAYLQMAGCRGLENFRGGYSLTALTPNAAALYIKLVNDENFDKGMEMLRAFASDENGENYSVNVELNIPADPGDIPVEIDYDDDYDKAIIYAKYLFIDAYSCNEESGPAAKLYREARSLLLNGRRADSAGNCVIVTINDYSSIRYGSSSFILKFSDAEIRRLREIIAEINVVEYGYQMEENYYPEGKFNPDD